jgi:hypothetical protein
MIGLVSASPRFSLGCRLKRHKRAYVSFEGMMIPWCKSCRERDYLAQEAPKASGKILKGSSLS